MRAYDHAEPMESLEPRMLLSVDMPDPSVMRDPANPLALFHTTQGAVVAELYESDAPAAVDAFKKLLTRSKPDATIVHRVSPGGDELISGLFRHEIAGLDFDAARLPLAGGDSEQPFPGALALGLMRNNPQRLNGEVIFTTGFDPTPRPQFVVGRVLTGLQGLRDASNFQITDLRGEFDVRGEARLRRVPIAPGSTPDDPEFLRLTDLRILKPGGELDQGLTERIDLVGGYATGSTAEWVTLENSGATPTIYEIVVRHGEGRRDRILERGRLDAGEQRLIRLQRGWQMNGVPHEPFFDDTADEGPINRQVRRRTPYTLSVFHSARSLSFDAELHRLRRAEDDSIRAFRVGDRLVPDQDGGFSTTVLDLDPAAASAGEIALYNPGETDLEATIVATAEDGTTRTFTKDIPALRQERIDLGVRTQLLGKATQFRVFYDGAILPATLFDTTADAEPARPRQHTYGPAPAARDVVRVWSDDRSPQTFQIYNASDAPVRVELEYFTPTFNPAPTTPPDPFVLQPLEVIELPTLGFNPQGTAHPWFLDVELDPLQPLDSVDVWLIGFDGHQFFN